MLLIVFPFILVFRNILLDQTQTFQQLWPKTWFFPLCIFIDSSYFQYQLRFLKQKHGLHATLSCALKSSFSVKLLICNNITLSNTETLQQLWPKILDFLLSIYLHRFFIFSVPILFFWFKHGLHATLSCALNCLSPSNCFFLCSCAPKINFRRHLPSKIQEITYYWSLIWFLIAIFQRRVHGIWAVIASYEIE